MVSRTPADQTTPSRASIKVRAYSGMGWASLARLVVLASRAIVTLVLARMLTSAAMGTIGLLNAIFALGMVVTELGLTAAIIQRRDASETHLATAFALNLAFGLLWAAGCIAAAPAVGRFYSNVVVSEVLSIYSIVFVIAAMASVQRALLVKSLSFRRLAVADGVASVVGGVITGVLAWRGLGVMAMVWGEIAMNLTATSLLWTSSTWRPSRRPSFKAFKELISFGSGVFTTKLLGSLNLNLAVFILGKAVTSAQLGTYTVSYQIARFYPALVNNTLASVSFPAFSQMQDDKGKLRLAFLYATRYLAVVSMPVMAGLMLVAPQFVLVILGERWADSVPVLRWLALSWMMTGLGGGPLWSSMLNAMGRSHSVAGLTTIRIAGLGAFVLIGAVSAGVVGAAFAAAVYAVAFRLIYQLILDRQLSLSMLDYLRSLGPAVRSTVPMIIVVSLLQLCFTASHKSAPAAQLVVMVAGGGLTYCLALRWLCKEEFAELASNARSALANARTGMS